MQRIIINTNVATQEHYDENGFSIRSGSPRLVANSEFILTWNLYSETPGANEDGVDVSTWTRHTGYAGCTARLGCDNDWMHRVSGTYAGEAITAGGAVPSSLTVTITGATDQNLSFSGLVTLFNASGEYETFLYTSRTISGNTVVFDVGSGLTAEHSYVNGNAVTCSQELLFQASADTYLSDSSNGVFVFKVHSASTKLKKILDTINGEIIAIQGLELLPFSVDGTTVTQYPSLFLGTPILVTTMQEVGTPDQISEDLADPIGEEVSVLLQSGISQEIWDPVSSTWEVYSGGSGDLKGRYWLTAGGSGAIKTEFPLVPGPPGSQGPAGEPPVLSGGTVTTLPAGSPASASLVSSGANTYYLDLALPQGQDGLPGSNGSNGVSPTCSVTQTSSGAVIVTSDAQGETSAVLLNGSDGRLAAEIEQYDISSAYAPLTFLTYNGGGYQVLSATSAGENPDNTPGKFLCFASKGADGSNGSNGVSPTVSITQITSGAEIVTSDYLGTHSATILNGSDGSNGSDGVSPTVSVTSVTSGAVIVTSDAQGEHSATILHGHLEGASEVVSALTSGAIVTTREAVPVALKTSAGNLYYLEKGTITISSGAWTIDPAAYLAYDGVSAFSGPWTVYYAGGIPDFQVIHSGGSAIDPQEHQVYQIPVSSGASITVNSSGLAFSMCMTAELWLDMPTPAVPFTLQSFTWVDGAAPDFTSASTRYAVTVRWNGTKFLANLAYTEALT